jgi:hypothetical protein
MKEKGNLKNIIIIAAIILAIGFAGYFYATRDQSSDDLLTGEMAGAASAVDGDLISALASLRRLRLDDSIFKSPTWTTLTDFGQTLSPLPSGRPNPFAAFPGESATGQ